MDMRLRAQTQTPAPTPAMRSFAAEPPAPSRGGAWTIDAATGKARLSGGVRRLLNVPDGEASGDFIARLPIDAASRLEVREAIRGCVELRADFDLKLRFDASLGPASVRLIGSAV